MHGFLKPAVVYSLSHQTFFKTPSFTFTRFKLSLQPNTKDKCKIVRAEMEFTATKRPCFKEGDDGLASLADMEAGFSGNSHRFFSRSSCLTRKSSLRNLSNSFVSAPRSARFYDARYEDYQPHFLEACSLCRKPLGDKDIFMYRGDTPFCSEECREQQIEIDEAKEKNWNRSSSMKAALRKRDQKKSTSPTKSQDYPLRTRTVAAA